MGTDPGDKLLQKGFEVLGQHMVNGRPLLDVMVPTAAWARKIAPRWAQFAANMSFSGIHWDTLGNWNNMEVHADLPGFLEAALPLLQGSANASVAQSCNFVDGFGWSDSLLSPGWQNNVIAFPYWEIWTLPSVEQTFFTDVAPGPRGGGVFVCYPGKGDDAMNLLIQRWQLAHCRGDAYLVIGDGEARLQTEYFPDTQALTADQVRRIQQEVLSRPVGSCPSLPGSLMWLWGGLVGLAVGCLLGAISVVVVRRLPLRRWFRFPGKDQEAGSVRLPGESPVGKTIEDGIDQDLLEDKA